VLVNPAEAANTETTSRDVLEAARPIGLQIRVINASTIAEIDAAFSTLAGERPDAIFVGASGFFATRCIQFVTLAARYSIPAAYSLRGVVVAGGLMSYGASFPDIYRQFGIYTGSILKGAKPTDLPVEGARPYDPGNAAGDR
jgi:putative tryptophan/tyrosine transport system substrate-binding protein